jgi:hypothetical protein
VKSTTAASMMMLNCVQVLHAVCNCCVQLRIKLREYCRVTAVIAA